MRHSIRYDGFSAWAGLVMLALAAPAAADHHVALHWSGELGVGYDDNVGNAAEDFDAIDSATVSGGLNLDYTRALSLNTGLLLRAGLQGEGYEAADGLSSARLLVMSRLSHRPTGGFYMPTFAGWLSVAVAEYDSAMRDGHELRGGVFVSEPLTTALAARLGVAVLERSSDNAVFETGQWSVGLNLDWQALPGLTLYGGYQYQDGDLVSTGTVLPKSSHIVGGCGTATECDPDDALDGQFAYQLDGSAGVATLGFNVPVSGALSVDGQLRRIDATAGENAYERLQGVVGLLARF